jgi:hypothetical protein
MGKRCFKHTHSKRWRGLLIHHSEATGFLPRNSVKNLILALGRAKIRLKLGLQTALDSNLQRSEFRL